MYGGAISSFWSSFNSGGIMGGVSVSGGYLSWWTNGAPASGNSIQGLDNHKTKIEQSSFNSFMKNWYSNAGKGNWFFGTSGVLSGFAGAVQSQNMYSQGLRRGLSGNYVLTGRNLSQFGRMPATKASLPISRIGRIGKFIGHGSFVLGVAFDGIGVRNYIINHNSPNAVYPAKAGINTIMGAVGNWGGTPGAIFGTFYFGVDAFYGNGTGWNGVMNDIEEAEYKADYNIDWGTMAPNGA